MVNACLTLASVHGANQPRPAFILQPISQSTPMESAGTGMTGNKETDVKHIFLFLLMT